MNIFLPLKLVLLSTKRDEERIFFKLFRLSEIFVKEGRGTGHFRPSQV